MNNNKVLSVFLLSICLLFSMPNLAKAESGIGWLKVEVLPSSSTAKEGFLNSTSTGFRVNFSLTDTYQPESIGLYVGSCISPIDSVVFDNGDSYYLSSGTSSLPELKLLLLNCSGKEEGENLIEVKGFMGGQYQTLYSNNIKSDFTGATGGDFSIIGQPGYIYKVGEKFDVIFDPTPDADIDSVSATLNDRELTFNKQGDKFVSSYIIREGDLDISGELILTDISILDLAGNIKNITKYSIPINFSIDANSPVVEISSPGETETISKSEVEIIYEANGYETISFYLNDEIVLDPILSGLTTGNYVFKIVAFDKAGNVTIRERKFSVDITGPNLSVISNPGEGVEGSEYLLSGNSEPLSKIELTIAGKVYSMLSDDLGKFNFKINDLKQGNYDYYLRAYDKYGNVSILNLGTLIIKAKPVDSSQSVVVARADVEGDYKSDKISVVSVTSESQEDQELAKKGKIISSSDERTIIDKNYNSWLILIALIIVSIALSSAGYYGYSLIGGSDEKTNIENTVVTDIESSDGDMQKVESEPNPEPKEEEKTDLRW